MSRRKSLSRIVSEWPHAVQPEVRDPLELELRRIGAFLGKLLADSRTRHVLTEGEWESMAREWTTQIDRDPIRDEYVVRGVRVQRDGGGVRG